MAPKGIELASAYISVSLNTDGAGRELKQFVRGIRDIEVDIDANVRPASQGVGRWRKDEERNEVNIDVDADTKGAAANVARWRVTEQAKPIKIRVDADTGRARREVDVLSSNLFKLGRSDVLKLNIGAAAITSLPMLVSGLAEVAAGIQQVAQAGLALPGIMAGASSSIGTLVFGLSGVGDAYDAMTKAADDAAKSGGDVASQQRAQMSASFGLRNAIVDEEEARKDVNRAIRDTIRNSQDLQLQMRGGVNDEKRAVHELAKARQRLATGDYSDYIDAVLDVEDAEIRVEEIRNRNSRTAAELTEANAKGVMGSDAVVAANERLIRSTQGVAQAEAAVAAAAPGATAAQENAALAMSKLSPEAQNFVNALMDVKGPFQTLRNLVQGNIFRGMDGELRSLAGKSMPMLEKGLGGIGDAWNNTFREIFRVAGEDETQGILSRIFGNTEEAQNILTGAIDPLTEGLGVLAEAGTRALPRMADGFVGLSDRFADFITKADESGKLDEWIGESITALGHLGEVVLNVGKMFTGITNAADGNFLENLERWTTNWQTWLNSAEGQNTLRDIFDEGKRIFNEWKPILESIPGLFKGIYDGASTYIGGVMTVVRPLTDFLSDHPDLVATAAGAYLVFKSAQVMGSFASLITMLGTTLPMEAEEGGEKAGKGFHSKFDSVIRGESWVALGAVISDGILGAFDDAFGSKLAETGVPGSGIWFLNLIRDPKGTLAKLLPGWFDGGDSGTSSLPPGAAGVPYGRVQDPGAKQSPLPPGAAIPGDVPSYMPGSNPLAAFTGTPQPGEDSRGFAHREKLPYWQSKGFEVGDHAADQYGEHQNGALDIMVPDIATGQQVLAEILKDPNVYGAIFDNKVYGYGQGLAPRPYSAGNTGNPTQDHQDHVHVWYKPGASGNLPVPKSVPVAPGGPVQGPPSSMPPPAGPPKTPTLEELLTGVPKFDDGGVWPHGTFGVNTSGKPEFVLNPEDIEYLKSQGIDPASLQAGNPVDPMTGTHGTGGGQAPGPLPGQAAPQRTEGYIPAAAGNTAPVGTGGASSLLDLGNQFVAGLIDTGATVAKMGVNAAISAGAAAGTFGAGAAAGPAAGAAAAWGIDTAAAVGKRAAEYGFDLAGIWIEAGVEQLFPFGAPRWLGSANPMAFMPQFQAGQGKKAPGTMGAAAKSIQSWAQPGNPALASMGTASQGAAAALQADPGVGQQTPPPQAQQQPMPGQQGASGSVNPMDPTTWLQFGGVFDNGGVWPAKSFAANLSKQPEYVFTQKQMSSMARTAANTTASQQKSGGDVHFHAENNAEMWRRYQWEQRRRSRTHSGRP